MARKRKAQEDELVRRAAANLPRKERKSPRTLATPTPPRDDTPQTDPKETRTSPRKRTPPPEEASPRNPHAGPCPHTVTAIRTRRQLAKADQRCPVCLEDYFDTPPSGFTIIPVKIACQHMFCRSCIETHRCNKLACPFPWCEAQFPLQPDLCNLCAYWERAHCTEPLLLTVRAREMKSSIETALNELAETDSFFKLSKLHERRLLKYIRDTLFECEWQYHSGCDLAELLDPFLIAVDAAEVRAWYGNHLMAPAPNPRLFPVRDNDPDDYPPGQEPWIAAFFRQWALEYEKENGEVKQGWGAWNMKRTATTSATPADADNEDRWGWPFKRLIAHKIEDGKVMYLVKWVGRRFAPTWQERGEFGDERAWRKYEKAKGVEGFGDESEAVPPVRKAKRRTQ